MTEVAPHEDSDSWLEELDRAIADLISTVARAIAFVQYRLAELSERTT